MNPETLTRQIAGQNKALLALRLGVPGAPLALAETPDGEIEIRTDRRATLLALTWASAPACLAAILRGRVPPPPLESR